MIRKYDIGLDPGVGSIGWAVTDENYKIIRVKGKDLIGVRLFNQASTAKERRCKRTSRRRYNRKKDRIRFIKSVFNNPINQIDPGFFYRLDDSKFFKEDKHVHQPFALFADTGYTDKEYYRDYPTVYHLIMELIQNPMPHDVRLVYLAISSLFKHRGHFLAANLNGDQKTNFETVYKNFKKQSEEVLNIKIPEVNQSDVIEDILISKEMKRSEKHKMLLEKCGFTSKDPFSHILKLCCGLKGNISKVFPEIQSEEDKGFSLSFQDSNLEEEMDTLKSSGLADEQIDLVLYAKQIYDQSLLDKIMKDTDGNTCFYLSEARVSIYNKHQKDLNILKSLYKTYAPQSYNSMFRTMGKNNYSAYIGSVHSKGKGKAARRGGKCNLSDFYNRVMKDVEKMPESDQKEYVLNEIECETFLPKQRTEDNGVIPNQIHARELKAILKNAENYLPFLKDKDETGLTNSEKIIQMFIFQIPYFVGPLNSGYSQNAWAVRKESGKVYPWNFDQKIDVRASSEKFIDRLVGKCTYLQDQRVLPKESLLYEKFRVLNELNNLRINGIRISVSMKQRFYNELFVKGKKVTQKKVKAYLIENGLVKQDEEILLSGIDGDFKNTLSSRKKFLDLFGTETLTSKQEDIAEHIIFWSTVYGNSREFLKERIESAYPDVFTEQQIKRILGFTFKDWGKLSEAFLNLEGKNKKTNKNKTLIQALWEGNGEQNYNLSELLSGDFTYFEEVEKRSSNNEKDLLEIDYSDLDDLYLSASSKRVAWQMILIIREIQEVLGAPPRKIFIETAKGNANQGIAVKDSRKKQLAKLYKDIKDDHRDWVGEINSHEPSDFRNKKLYLYYTQMGRCAYTGEEIDLNELFNNNIYDIDHIYPKHFRRDDSELYNLVLVKKIKNAHKKDKYPIDCNIQKRQKDFWKKLLDYKLITQEKYYRLTRTNPLTDTELAQFINRDLVETRQATKSFAHLLESSMPDTEIVYVKASNVSFFRHQAKLPKCRSLNDLHHAHDAYLNIVVGNAYLTKFTKHPSNFIKEYRKDPNSHPYHMYNLFKYNITRGNTNAWIADNNKSLNMVKKMIQRTSPLITKRSYEKHSDSDRKTKKGIADQNISKAKDAAKTKGVGYLPIKESDPRLADMAKYGGYTNITGSYFFLVEHTVKNKRVRTLESVPIYLSSQLQSKENLKKYCETKLKLVEPSIRIEKIKTNALIRADGMLFYLTGRSGNSLTTENAFQLYLDMDKQNYIRLLDKYQSKGLTAKQMEKEKVDPEHNLKLYDVFLSKSTQTVFKYKLNKIGKLLEEGRDRFIALDFKDQVNTLLEIEKLFTRDNHGANLLNIGGKKYSGVMRINKKISNCSSVTLIYQSVTGLFEKEVDLLTV